MTSWAPGAAGSTYDVDNLPYAVFTTADDEPRVGVRIGGHVLDVAPVAAAEMLDVAALFEQDSLNPLLSAGPRVWASVRTWLTQLLLDEAERDVVEPHLVPLDEVTTRLPFRVADYVDFLCGKQHAENAGRIFRPDAEPLGANFTSLPIGYHGRAGTVVVSGTPVVRPRGQRPSSEGPTFGPTTKLDLEAELGFVVGAPSAVPVATDAFADHVFGVTLLNDWSARDIQAWESQPLGPFLGKSFAVTISDWVTPLAALEAAPVALPVQEPEPLEYLRVEEPAGYDVDVEIVINGEVVSRPPYSSMYWSPAQMLAHLTSNGSTLRTGDLFGSGTITGPEREQRGCLLELSWGGQEPFLLDGRERSWLEDGDVVTLRATAPGTLGGRIALGEVTGTVLPAP